MSLKRNSLMQLIISAVCLALCMVLPFLTGQIPQIGSALSPMHLPVLLCGFLCGPVYALAVGAVAPPLRFALFGMPPIFPTGVAMCFELAAYGVISSLMYRRLPRKKLSIAYFSSFALSAASTRAGVKGNSLIHTPQALYTAMRIAGPPGASSGSPTPFAPKG